MQKIPTWALSIIRLPHLATTDMIISSGCWWWAGCSTKPNITSSLKFPFTVFPTAKRSSERNFLASTNPSYSVPSFDWCKQPSKPLKITIDRHYITFQNAKMHPFFLMEEITNRWNTSTTIALSQPRIPPTESANQPILMNFQSALLFTPGPTHVPISIGQFFACSLPPPTSSSPTTIR